MKTVAAQGGRPHPHRHLDPQAGAPGRQRARAVRRAGEAEPRAGGRGRSRAGRPRTAMTGKLEEVPLPDLLQLFHTSKKNGVLVVHGRARGPHLPAPGQDLLRGHRRQPRPGPAEELQPHHHLGARRLRAAAARQPGVHDRARRARPRRCSWRRCASSTSSAASRPSCRRLTDDAAQLAVPMEAPLRDLTPEELDVLQLVRQLGHPAGRARSLPRGRRGGGRRWC